MSQLEALTVRDRAERVRLSERLAALPIGVWLAGIVAVSAGVRLLFALWVPAPWLFIDELKYSELAKSFAATGHFAIRDMQGVEAWPLYPLLIAPAYAAFDNLPHAYMAVKAINSVLMSTWRPCRRTSSHGACCPGVARLPRRLSRSPAFDGLRGERDDREPLLSGLPHGSAGDHSRAGAPVAGRQVAALAWSRQRC